MSGFPEAKVMIFIELATWKGYPQISRNCDVLGRDSAYQVENSVIFIFKVHFLLQYLRYYLLVLHIQCVLVRSLTYVFFNNSRFFYISSISVEL